MSARLDRRGFLGGSARGALALGLSQPRARAQAVRPPATGGPAGAGRAELHALHRAVREAVASGRIGAARFVRYLLECPRGTRLGIDDVAGLAAVVATWLDEPVERVYALGAPGRAISVTLVFRGGGTALVAVHRGATPTPLPDVTVIGSRGALYHDASVVGRWRVDGDGKTEAVAMPGLAAALARSLRSGRPEILGAGG